MAKKRYTLEKLREHTESIRNATRPLISDSSNDLDNAIRAFEVGFCELEGEASSLSRSVRLLLATRFFNHVYSTLLLSEAGLVADAVGCERAALETLAAFRLVSVAAEYATTYETEDFPRPVEVRKCLEELGLTAEARQIRELYASACGVLHVSRASEQWNTRWASEGSGALLLGGTFTETDYREMLRFIPALLHWFFQPLDR